jgi:hypothetical protein
MTKPLSFLPLLGKVLPLQVTLFIVQPLSGVRGHLVTELACSRFAGVAAYSRTGNAVHVVRIATVEINDTAAVAADAFQERFGGRCVTVKEVAPYRYADVWAPR